jgi:hypothetical protein
MYTKFSVPKYNYKIKKKKKVENANIYVLVLHKEAMK